MLLAYAMCTNENRGVVGKHFQMVNEDLLASMFLVQARR